MELLYFKNSSELRDTFKHCIRPIKKIIIETDSPFLESNTNERKKNEPIVILNIH